MRVNVIDQIVDFANLKDEWNELLNSSNSTSIFLTWDWLYTWWAIFSENRSLEIITVRNENGLLLGIAPFVKRSITYMGFVNITRIEFLGTGEGAKEEVCSNNMDIIVRQGYEETILDCVWNFIKNNGTYWDELLLFSVSSESIISRNKFNGCITKVIKNCQCPIIILPNSWEDYLQSLSSKMRQQFRRQRKRLLEQGRVAYKQAKSLSEIYELFKLLKKFSIKRWNMTDKKSVFTMDRWIRFQIEILNLFFHRGLILFSYLEFNNRIVAISYRYVFKGTVFAYQVCDDIDFNRNIGIGMIERGFNIQRVIESNYSIYDFYKSSKESYKFRMATGSTNVIDLRIRRKKFKMHLLCFVEKIISLLRILKNLY